MFKFLRKNKKGFTLVELIVVIAILAILAAVAVPAFLGLSNDAQASVRLANAKIIATSLNAYNALNPTTPKANASDWTSLPDNLKITGMPSGDELTAIQNLVKYDSTTKSFYVEAASPSASPST